MADNFNLRDIGIGIGIGWTTAYILYQMRDAIGEARRGVSTRVQGAQAYASLSAEGRYIAEFNREAQASHLGGEQIPLTQIAVEPRFWPPSKFAEPPDDDIHRDVFRVIPKIADLPYLAQPYNVETATIDDLYNGSGAYALLGAPGSGRTTALYLIGLMALGAVSFPAPEDKVSERLKAEEAELDANQKADRLKFRLTIEDQAFERLAQEKGDAGLRAGDTRRQADLALRPYRDKFPVYVHLADVRPSNFKGRTDPAEPLVRGLQAQVGATTAKALPRRLYPRLEQGGVLLLLDGYDDLAADHQQEIAEWLPELIAQYAGAGNHILVSGPAHGYAPLVQAGLTPLVMRPWSDTDIETAAAKWADAWPEYLAGRKRRGAGGAKPDNRQVTAAVTAARGLSPAEITLKINAAYRGEFSRSPGAWIESYLTNLKMPDSALQIARRAAAVQLNQHEITAARLVDVGGVADNKPATASKALIDLFRRGLLVEVGRGEYQFRHDAVGDYLAAQTLIEADDGTMLTVGATNDWAGALAFASGMRSVDTAVAGRLDPAPDLLLTGLTTLARWLAYLDGKPAWRANVLRMIGNQFVQPGQYPYARERLAAALAGSRDPEASSMFERSLKSPDPDVRRLSALALGVLRHQGSVETLGAMSRDVEGDVALAATAALGAIGTDEAHEQLARAFAFGDENVRQMAAETFAILPDVGYETLYDATRHENMDYRRAAVFGLRRMKTGWALIEIYRVFLEDSEWYVRSAAQEAIIDFQNKSTARALSPYPTLTRIEWLREFAQRHGIKGETAATDALNRMIGTADPVLQPVAVQAVGQLGMVDRAGVLYRALLDAQPVVRDTAHRSLADIELQYDAPLPAPA